MAVIVVLIPLCVLLIMRLFHKMCFLFRIPYKMIRKMLKDSCLVQILNILLSKSVGILISNLVNTDEF